MARYVTCCKNRKIVYGKSILDLCRKVVLIEDCLCDGDEYEISVWGSDTIMTRVKYHSSSDTFLRYYPDQWIPASWKPVQGCQKITSEPNRPRYR